MYLQQCEIHVVNSFVEGESCIFSSVRFMLFILLPCLSFETTSVVHSFASEEENRIQESETKIAHIDHVDDGSRRNKKIVQRS